MADVENISEMQKYLFDEFPQAVALKGEVKAIKKRSEKLEPYAELRRIKDGFKNALYGERRDIKSAFKLLKSYGDRLRGLQSREDLDPTVRAYVKEELKNLGPVYGFMVESEIVHVVSEASHIREVAYATIEGTSEQINDLTNTCEDLKNWRKSLAKKK